jgi:ZIP family zinc transporter
MDVIFGILMPFIGTALGSGMVFVMKDKLNDKRQKVLLGFASGVMIAAAIWSLILPSIEMSIGIFSWLPATIGFIFGILGLIIIDPFIDKIESKWKKNKNSNILMLIIAVTIHNIPEGMAVGVAFAGALATNSSITMIQAIILALGVAIQNFPEGAIISMPLKMEGTSRKTAFIYGVFSGIVEPIAAIITILLINIVVPLLPYLLSFAAGAMIYVVIEELVPEMAEGEHSNWGTIAFMTGFALMMILDVALG